jgi:hypothetical protein
VPFNNPFKSKTSTNMLRGWPVSGRLLTVDFEEYWFDQSDPGRRVTAHPVTLRVFENGELAQVLNAEAEALIALFIDEQELHEMSWPNGSTERWTKQTWGALVRVSGGYGSGAVIAAKDEFRQIARGLLSMMEECQHDLPAPEQGAGTGTASGTGQPGNTAG